MAFRYFSDENVDIAVVEVGLGGRLDATNILLPLVSVITSLSLDHTYLLGDTIEEIATEKGGIIKPNVPVVSAPQAIEAEKRLVDIARTKISPFTLVGRDWDCRLVLPNSADAQLASINGQEIVITHTPEESFVEPGERFTISLMGYHQVENALVALAAMNEVRTNFPKLTTKYAHMGLAEINWPGRLQTLTQGADRPTVLVDCAHNVDSAEKLALALKENYRYQKLFLVLGVTADKDVAGIMEALLPHAYQTFLTASTHPRACALDDLLGVASELGQKSQISENVADAFQAAWKAADPEDLICVTGSIFVVGDLLNQWEVLQSKVVANGDRFLTGSTDLIRDH
jgi:dihydrofolate synthase/folylpolyglutamate synthase